jgi:hypothetical protein
VRVLEEFSHLEVRGICKIRKNDKGVGTPDKKARKVEKWLGETHE